MKLYDEICDLFSLKTEGDYWDFKEMWHSNKADLLHDIICMANNQVGRDAYIVIGVSDSKSVDGVKIKGVSDENRKDQQHLIDFLRDKKFAGGIRPVVYLQTIEMFNDDGDEKSIDVIIIKSTAKTPYFLLESFRDRDRELRAGYIYTRIGDTNTAKDSFADLDKIEYLWRKRFGIDLSVNEKLLRLLDNPDGWIGDFNNGDCRYHSIYPEFQIRISDCEDEDDYRDNSIVRNIADHNSDKKFAVNDIVITYHTTVLYTEKVLYLDGYRHLIPLPATKTVYLGRYHESESSLTYLYFDLSTVMGKLYNCLAVTEHNWYYEKWHMIPGVAFLVFDDTTEQQEFDAFVDIHLQEVLDDYNHALSEKGYIKTAETQEYYCFGCSKANEIKSWQLYEMYRGMDGRSIADKIPQYCEPRGDK